MHSESPIRILLLGDNEPYSKALKCLLNHQPVLYVCGQITIDSEIFPVIEWTRPHLVILESYKPHDGIIKIGRAFL